MLANGRQMLAIPGPSVMPDRVLAAMHRAAPNIYAGELVALTAALIPDLKAVARTRHRVAIYIGNGHAIWEAALANTAAPGDKVLIPATGRFGHGWAEMARRMGIGAEILDFGMASPMDLSQVEARLAADKTREIRAVLAVHTDTSTSIRNDLPALRAAIDRAGHPAVLMADCMASLGCDMFEMDKWGIDVTLAGSQKGLMTPPGLGFVWFNDKAEAARARLKQVSAYWDWVPRANPEEYWQYFDGTAPTHHLYGLREALTMIVREEGVEAAWARHARLARALWAAFEMWGREGPMALNVADPAYRSHAVTSARLGPPHATVLRDWTEAKAGLTLGIGLGMAPSGDPAWHGFFRVGHMGHVNAHMMMGTLGAIDAGLKALGLPHGRGALEAASEVIAGA
jgi:alanine-glyoxylate transaminase/serine-glyoxylate transaminase/serine-pyruvate transaminase